MNKNELIPIDTPVSTKQFLKKFTKKVQAWDDFIITPALKETWKLNCLAMNNAVHRKAKVLKFVVSAPTGSAKTQNVITYCSMLPELVTALISTNLTSEADLLAKSINDEAQKEIACAFHAKNNINIDDAMKHQIVIVTHEFYRRNQAGTQKWGQLGEKRDLIIIDEVLDTMKEVSVKSSDIYRAISILSHLNNWQEYQNNKYFLKELGFLKEDYDKLIQVKEKYGTGTNLISSDKMWLLKDSKGNYHNVTSFQPTRYNLFLNILESNTTEIKFNEILTGINDRSKDRAIRSSLLESINALNSLRGRQVYITANRGEYSLNRVVDSTPHHSLVCFDATADVNTAYELRTKYYNDLIRVRKVENVRNYLNVNIYTVNVKTSKDAIQSIISNILDSISFGEKTLLVTHKSNKSLFEEVYQSEHKNKMIDFAHWNAITGLNKWKDFDTCVIAGLNHKPKSYAQNRVIVNTGNEGIAFGKMQSELNNDIEESVIIAEIIQAINRIRIRTVTTKSGGCSSANIYLTLPVLNGERFKMLIKEQMPGINFKEWKLSGIVSGNTNRGHKDILIQYLKANMSVGGTILQDEPRDVLAINKDSYRDIVGKNPRGREKFAKFLSNHGFNLEERYEQDARGRQRKTPIRYITRVK